MTSFVAKTISKKILGESLSNKFGKEDPYFETVPATRLDGKPTGKVKRRKKALPPGLSEHDGQVLTKVKRRAHRMDMALFSFLGIRFGWGSALGIIPVVGDFLDAFMALMVLKTCMQIEGGLPFGLKFQMMFNIALDFAIGLVPFLGDLADAMFKANTRNALLLEQHLREVGKKNLRKSGLPIPTVDPSSPVEFDKGTFEESPQQSPHRRAGNSTTAAAATASQGGRHQQQPSQPQPAHVQDSGARGSFFSRNKTRPSDVEMGVVDSAGRTVRSEKPKRSGRR